MPGSQADRSGVIKLGDLVAKVNMESCAGKSYGEVLEMISAVPRSAERPLVLTLAAASSVAARPLVRYRCVRPCMARDGASLESKKVGLVQDGEYVHVSAKTEWEPGLTRICFSHVVTDALAAIDTNGDGILDEDEMRCFSDKLGMSLSDAELKGMMEELDADGNGTVELDELRAYLEVLAVEQSFGGVAGSKAASAAHGVSFSEVLSRWLTDGELLQTAWATLSNASGAVFFEAAPEAPPRARYRCLRTCIVRAAIGLDSEQVGMVSAGEHVYVSSTKGTEHGVQRICFTYVVSSALDKIDSNGDGVLDADEVPCACPRPHFRGRLAHSPSATSASRYIRVAHTCRHLALRMPGCCTDTGRATHCRLARRVRSSPLWRGSWARRSARRSWQRPCRCSTPTRTALWR